MERIDAPSEGLENTFKLYKQKYEPDATIVGGSGNHTNPVVDYYAFTYETDVYVAAHNLDHPCGEIILFKTDLDDADIHGVDLVQRVLGDE